MKKLLAYLFDDVDFSEREDFINSMTVDDLMDLDGGYISRILHAFNGRLGISRKRRQGNHWNSEVDGIEYLNGKICLSIYVQDDSTDTNYTEYYSTFFRRGEYYSRENRLGVGVDYKEGDKAEVMRSILLSCIDQLFGDDVEKKKAVEELGRYTIINPVLNDFYDELRLKYNQISKYSTRSDVVRSKGYHAGEKAIKTYISDNWRELQGKSIEELQDLYKETFKKGYDDFDKGFDFDEWRKDAFLFN
jgi:hypothetical protein